MYWQWVWKFSQTVPNTIIGNYATLGGCSDLVWRCHGRVWSSCRLTCNFWGEFWPVRNCIFGFQIICERFSKRASFHWFPADSKVGPACNMIKPNPMTPVLALCDNKQTCNVGADNTLFGGDPCVGTKKSAWLSYACGEFLDVIKFHAWDQVWVESMRACMSPTLQPRFWGYFTNKLMYEPQETFRGWPVEVLITFKQTIYAIMLECALPWRRLCSEGNYAFISWQATYLVWYILGPLNICKNFSIQ